jgi:hypothetical protein
MAGLQFADAVFVIDEPFLLVGKHVLQAIHVFGQLRAQGNDLINDLLKPTLQSHPHASVFVAQPPKGGDKCRNA